MSDVEISIRRWREALAERESFSPDKLDELQDHLEAELERIPSGDFAEEERVLIAAHRVGMPGQLERAFLEVDAGYANRRRALWMVFGLFVLSILPKAVLSITGPFAIWVFSSHRVPTSLVSIGLVLAHTLVWLGLVYGVWRYGRGYAANCGIASWLTSRPLIAFTGLIFAAVTLSLFSSVMRVIVFDHSHIQTVGTIALWEGRLNFLSALLVPAILVLMVWNWSAKPSAAH